MDNRFDGDIQYGAESGVPARDFYRICIVEALDQMRDRCELLEVPGGAEHHFVWALTVPELRLVADALGTHTADDARARVLRDQMAAVLEAFDRS